MARKEIRIAGFGGQGVVLSGSILGKASSIFSTGHAALTQSYGPESRGGSCCAEVVTDSEPVDYPYVTYPKVQIILSQEAYTKYGETAPEDTLIIIDSDLVKVSENHKAKLLSIPANRLAREEIGRAVVANIIMLGFLSAVSDFVSYDAVKNAILDTIPAGTERVNMQAFELGYKYGTENGGKVSK